MSTSSGEIPETPSDRLDTADARPPTSAPVRDRALRELGPRTGEYVGLIADELIDEFAPACQEDLVLRFARAVPLLVMEGLLGMDERHSAGVGQRVPEILADGCYADRAAVNLDLLLRRHVLEKQQAAGPDLVSWMLHLGPHLAPDEVAHLAGEVLLDGVAASTVMISHRLYLRLAEPQQDPRMPDAARTAGGVGADPYGLPGSVQVVVELIVQTALERLYARLPDLRLRMPARELLWAPVRSVSCPESLPVVFTRAPMIVTGPVCFLPEPIFTTRPPTVVAPTTG